MRAFCLPARDRAVSGAMKLQLDEYGRLMIQARQRCAEIQAGETCPRQLGEFRQRGRESNENSQFCLEYAYSICSVHDGCSSNHERFACGCGATHRRPVRAAGLCGCHNLSPPGGACTSRKTRCRCRQPAPLLAAGRGNRCRCCDRLRRRRLGGCDCRFTSTSRLLLVLYECRPNDWFLGRLPAIGLRDRNCGRREQILSI